MAAVMQHTNKDMDPSTFEIKPTSHTFTAKLLKPMELQTKKNEREKVNMKGTQLHMVSTTATTGHKLQGRGIDELFVHSWSYVANWVYVMLSRVKTLDGLYMRKPLSTDLRKYAVKPELTFMLNEFETRQPAYFTAAEYNDICNLE